LLSEIAVAQATSLIATYFLVASSVVCLSVSMYVHSAWKGHLQNDLYILCQVRC